MADSGENEFLLELVGITFSPFSPDGRHLVTSGPNGPAYLWDVSGKAPVATELPVKSGETLFTRDGRWLITLPDVDETEDWGQRAAQPGQLGQPEQPPQPEQRGADDARTGRTPRLLLWRVPTPTDLTPVALTPQEVRIGGSFPPFVLDSGGRWLAAELRRGVLSLWDLNAKDQIRRSISLPERRVSAYAFSPDGRWLLTTNARDTVRLWSIGPTGPGDGPAATLLGGGEDRAGGRASLSALRFSPDGRWLAIASDSTLRLWDLQALRRNPSNIEPIALKLRGESSLKLKFTADSTWLIVADSEGIEVWPIGVDNLAAMAERVTGRTLTRSEREQFKVPARPAPASSPAAGAMRPPVP